MYKSVRFGNVCIHIAFTYIFMCAWISPWLWLLIAAHDPFLVLYSISLFIFLCSRLCREISFQFRTRLPHGLLVYHNVKNPDGIELDPYALYVIVEKGQLKVVHVFGKHSTSVTVGEGLNRDEWHSVMVGKTPSNPSFPYASCSVWNFPFFEKRDSVMFLLLLFRCDCVGNYVVREAQI